MISTTQTKYQPHPEKSQSLAKKSQPLLFGQILHINICRPFSVRFNAQIIRGPFSVAYLGFYFGGGGGSKYLGKVGVFAWLCIVLHARGSGDMLPRENFKNGAIWCVLENILLKFCKNKIVKILIFI